MPKSRPEKEWSDTMSEIAKGWLFHDIPDKTFPKRLILPLENPDLHDHSRFTSKLESVRHYSTISTGYYKDKYIGILKSKFGSPAVAMTITLLSKLNVECIIGIGFCGGLHKEINSGDIVFPLACIRDDGTTSKYVSSNYPAVADIQLLDLLRGFARTYPSPWHCGIVWSTDSIMLETSDLVEEWSGHKAIGVDMESGTLLTISRILGISAASILVASDNPLLQRQANVTKLASGVDVAIEIGLKTLEKFSPVA